MVILIKKLKSLINKYKLTIQILLTTDKFFIRPHLHYGDILHDKTDNENFQNNIKKSQHKVSQKAAGAMQGSQREKPYENLGLHSLVERQWRSKLIFFNK